MRNLASLLAVLIATSSAPMFAGDDPTKPVSYEWTKVTLNAEFAPRDGAGALSYKGKMWLIGGWNPIGKYRDTFPLICNSASLVTALGRASDGRVLVLLIGSPPGPKPAAYSASTRRTA